MQRKKPTYSAWCTDMHISWYNGIGGVKSFGSRDARKHSHELASSKMVDVPRSIQVAVRLYKKRLLVLLYHSCWSTLNGMRSIDMVLATLRIVRLSMEQALRRHLLLVEDRT